MKLSILQENLATGLSTVNRLVATKTQLPVLGNILLATDNGRLKLSATNLETGINLWLGAKIEEEGAITIPARILTEFITSLPKEKVQLRVSENTLFVSCLSFEASLNGLAASEFPSLLASLQKPSFTLDASLFSHIINQVSFAAATDEGRPVLTGILMIFKNKGMTVVATDGFRLSLKKITNLPFSLVSGKEELRLIFPSRALSEIGRIITEGKVEEKEELKVTLTENNNQAIFNFKNIDLITRLIEGEFPNFEKIIPQSFSTQVLVEKEELVKAVKIASIFARDSANIIKFSLNKELILTANTPQVGENKSIIEAKISGVKNEIAFNSRYLLDLLNNFPPEEGLLSLEITGPLNPGVFKVPDDDSFLHLIMPVRLQG